MAFHILRVHNHACFGDGNLYLESFPGLIATQEPPGSVNDICCLWTVTIFRSEATICEALGFDCDFMDKSGSVNWSVCFQQVQSSHVNGWLKRSPALSISRFGSTSTLCSFTSSRAHVFVYFRAPANQSAFYVATMPTISVASACVRPHVIAGLSTEEDHKNRWACQTGATDSPIRWSNSVFHGFTPPSYIQ